MTQSVQNRKSESYKIFNEIAKTYDLLNHLLSFGIDIYWRNKLLKYLPKRSELNCLDLATGTGDVAITLTKATNIKTITAMDLSEGMIKYGIKKVAEKKLDHIIKFQVGCGVEVPVPENSVDVTTLSFGIRNFPDPQKSLHNIYKATKNNGKVLVMEFSLPESRIVRAVYFFYFRHLLPFIGNLISKHKDAYTYLNESVEDFPYGEDFLQLMKNAGFKNCKIERLSFGIASIYSGEVTDK